MRYYKHRDIDLPKKGITYFELDDHYAVRHIEIRENEILSSIAFSKSGKQPILAEKSLEGFDELEEINKSEFEEKWELVLDSNKSSWAEAKKNYLINSKITVSTLMFYPQGVLATIGETLFLIEDSDYENAVVREKRYPGTEILVSIEEYIENMQWIKVSTIAPNKSLKSDATSDAA